MLSTLFEDYQQKTDRSTGDFSLRRISFLVPFAIFSVCRDQRSRNMKIYVLIKQVPDTETKIKLRPDNSGFDESGVKWVMNPYDEFAVEEALKFKESHAGSQVLAVTVGPKARAAEVVRTALAMGADEGLVINAATPPSPLDIARALSAVIQKEGAPHLVFGGKLAIDDNAGSVCQQVAELLAIPCSSVVSKVTYQGDRVTVEREVEGGSREIVELQYPAVLAVNKGLNTPRYASLPGIMKAKKKPLKEFEFSDLVTQPADQMKFEQWSLPAEKPPARMVAGAPDQQVQQLVQLLRNEAKVL
jgi:electron transfer flavoprotein beta subunit